MSAAMVTCANLPRQPPLSAVPVIMGEYSSISSLELNAMTLWGALAHARNGVAILTARSQYHDWYGSKGLVRW